MNEFQIFHHDNTNSEIFPKDFKIDFQSFGKRFVKNFALVEKNDSHPIGSNKVFTMNENGIENIKVDYHQVKRFPFFHLKKDKKSFLKNLLKKYELYQEIDGFSTATLIKNEGSKNRTKKFRIVIICFKFK